MEISDAGGSSEDDDVENNVDKDGMRLPRKISAPPNIFGVTPPSHRNGWRLDQNTITLFPPQSNRP